MGLDLGLGRLILYPDLEASLSGKTRKGRRSLALDFCGCGLRFDLATRLHALVASSVRFMLQVSDSGFEGTYTVVSMESTTLSSRFELLASRPSGPQFSSNSHDHPHDRILRSMILPA